MVCGMLKVLICSDNLLFARLLSEKLQSLLDSATIDLAIQSKDALEAVRDGAVDVLVADASMDGSVALVRAVSAPEFAVTTLVFGLHRDDAEISTFAEAGAAGLTLMDADIEDLGRAIRDATTGECPCSPGIAAALLRHVARLSRQGAGGAAGDLRGERLTAREVEIARLLDAGRTNKEIARALSIEVATAKNHVHNILRKLNAPSRAKAVAKLRSLDIT